jgi:hypothetical protein
MQQTGMQATRGSNKQQQQQQGKMSQNQLNIPESPTILITSALGATGCSVVDCLCTQCDCGHDIKIIAGVPNKQTLSSEIKKKLAEKTQDIMSLESGQIDLKGVDIMFLVPPGQSISY